MNILSVCTGVMGLDYGLHRAGFATVAACEAEGYPRQVIARHAPGIPVHEDMRTLDGRQYRGRVQMVAGGIPCQPFSDAGQKLGTDDPRHLFPHFLRLMFEADAEVGLIENVRGLLSTQSGRAFGEIVRESVEAGFTVEWQMLAAGTLGACHIRRRVFIVLRKDGRWAWEGPRQVGLFGSAPWSRSVPSSWPKAGRATRQGWVATPERWPEPAVWPWLVAGEAMMPTPTRNDEKGADYQKGKGDRVYLTLPGAAKLREGVAVQEGLRRMLPTPAAHDYKGCNQPGQRRGQLGEAIGEYRGGKLRPQPVEWMQGWPDGWTLTDGPSLLDAPPPQQERWPDYRWTTSEPEDNRRPRLKACGNGVYSLCGEAVGLDLAASLGAARGAA